MASPRAGISPQRSKNFFAPAATYNLGIFIPLESEAYTAQLKQFAIREDKDFAWLIHEDESSPNLLFIDLICKDPEQQWQTARFSFKCTRNDGWICANEGDSDDEDAIEITKDAVLELFKSLRTRNIGEGYSNWLALLKNKSFTEDTRALPSQRLQSDNPAFNPPVPALPPLHPQAFICPLSHQEMVNPVATLEGHSYEKEALLKDINRPKVRIVNYALKRLINDVNEYNATPDLKEKLRKLNAIQNESLLDSVTRMPWKDPMLAADGQTYEKGESSGVITERGRSPLINIELKKEERIAVPNHAVKNFIVEFQSYVAGLQELGISLAPEVKEAKLETRESPTRAAKI